ARGLEHGAPVEPWRRALDGSAQALVNVPARGDREGRVDGEPARAESHGGGHGHQVVSRWASRAVRRRLRGDVKNAGQEQRGGDVLSHSHVNLAGPDKSCASALIDADVV